MRHLPTAQLQHSSRKCAWGNNEVIDVCKHCESWGRPIAQRWQLALKGKVWSRAHDPIKREATCRLELLNIM